MPLAPLREPACVKPRLRIVRARLQLRAPDAVLPAVTKFAPALEHHTERSLTVVIPQLSHVMDLPLETSAPDRRPRWQTHRRHQAARTSLSVLGAPGGASAIYIRPVALVAPRSPSSSPPCPPRHAPTTSQRKCVAFWCTAPSQSCRRALRPIRPSSTLFIR